jgi:hypothetical protein
MGPEDVNEHRLCFLTGELRAIKQAFDFQLTLSFHFRVTYGSISKAFCLTLSISSI